MKRINVKLVGGLALGTVLFGAGSIGLFLFQYNRRADGLLVRATQLREEGEYSDAVRLINDYLRRRPNATKEYSVLALTLKQLIEQYETEDRPFDPHVVRNAFGALERALRKNPDDIEIRKAAVEFDMKFARYDDAIVHIKHLLQEGNQPNEAELRVNLSRCYFLSGKEEQAKVELSQLIGFDESTRFFRVDQALAPDEITAYALLASLFERNQRSELADLVIEQAVRQNPESSSAYLARASFRNSNRNDMAGARSDSVKAAELAPEDESVLLAAADLSMATQDFDEARLLYDKVLKVDPENIRAYMGLSRWSAEQGDLKQSLAYLDEAAERAPDSLEVLWQRANTELQRGNSDAAEAALQKIIAADAVPWFVTFLEGRIAVSRREWLTAAEKLEEARPMVSQLKPKWTKLLDLNLAACYANLGQQDMRLSVLKRVLDSNPDDLTARLNKAQAQASLGLADEAVNDYEFIRSRLPELDKVDAKTLMALLELEILKQKQRDQARRDWKTAEQIVRTIGLNATVPRRVYGEIMARYLMASGQSEREKQLRARLQEQNPDSLQYAMEEILRKGNSKEGFEEGMALLHKTREERGDLPELRILEAQLIATRRPDDMDQQLAKLENGVEQFDEAKQAAMWFQLGRLYAALERFDDAKRVWSKFGELRPKDPNHLVRMFELALMSGDDAGTQAAIKSFADVMPQGRDSAEWKWAKAAYLAKQIREEKVPRSKVTQAQALLNEAISQRELWEPLYRLQGEVSLLDDNLDEAIEAYERAVELGSTNLEAYRRLARMYYQRNDFDRAREMIAKLPPEAREPIDRQINIDLMARLGDLPEDMEYNESSTDANDHLTMGGLFVKAQKFERAETAFKRAIELAPERSTTWGSLFELYITTGQEANARELLTEAATKVDPKNSAMLFGVSYHLLKEWDKSESAFKQALAESPDSLEVMMALAKLYLASNQLEKSKEILASMIEKEPPYQRRPKRSVAWARRQLAEVVGASGNYPDYLMAVRLLEENAPEGGLLSPADLLVYAKLSANRPESVTRRKAVKRLERASDQRRLSDNELLILAGLYKQQGDWTDCNSVMLDLMTRHGDDARYIVPWLSWLIDEKDFAGARVWVKKIPGNTMPAVRTKAHLAAASGKVDDAIRTVAALFPKGRERTVEDVPQLVSLASILEELGAYDPKAIGFAERVWKEIVKVEPNQIINLAAFYNRRDDAKYAQLAMDTCQACFKQGGALEIASLQLSLSVLRDHYGQLMGNKENINSTRELFQTAMEEHPESGYILVMRAEFEDLVGQGEDATEFMREFLAKPGMRPREVALVQNNLAYKLAWDSDASEALPIIESAMEVLGPRADVLDTMGVVQIANGQMDEGIASLQASIENGGPSALKYFHLAYGYWKKGDESAAATAIRDAMPTDINAGQMGGGERRAYDNLRRQLKEKGLLE